MLHSSHGMVKRLLFRFQLRIGRQICSVTDSEKFSAGIQSVHARQRLLKKRMRMIHNDISIDFFIFPDLIIGKLAIIIYQIQIFSFRKSSLLKNRMQTFIHMIKFDFCPGSLTGTGYGITEKKWQVDLSALTCFHQPQKRCSSEIHAAEIRIVFLSRRFFQFQIAADLFFHQSVSS